MRSLVGILLLTVVISGCSNSGRFSAESDNLPAPLEIIAAEGVSIPVYDFKSFSPYLDRNNDTIYIINFWASWCKPCIQEMPEFIELAETYKHKPVKLILVSLDFYNSVNERLIPYIRDNHIREQVVLLNDPDADAWIGKVDTTWTGSIPATLIYHKEKRYFFEKQMSFNELESIIKTNL